MDEKRERRLAQLRANNRRYYEAHKQELSEKRKTARQAKLAAMSPEEREAYNARNREYQRKYRQEHPDRVAIWTARTWLRKLEKTGQEIIKND